MILKLVLVVIYLGACVVQLFFLLWLIVGAAALFVRCNFPRVVVVKLPQESLLKGLFMFGSWLLWPVWALTLPAQA